VITGTEQLALLFDKTGALMLTVSGHPQYFWFLGALSRWDLPAVGKAGVLLNVSELKKYGMMVNSWTIGIGAAESIAGGRDLGRTKGLVGELGCCSEGYILMGVILHRVGKPTTPHLGTSRHCVAGRGLACR